MAKAYQLDPKVGGHLVLWDGLISQCPCNDDGSCYSALEIVGDIIIII